MKKLGYTLLCSLLFLFANAQNEGLIWYFGSMAGLDFTSGTPVQLFDGAIQAFQGCATANDANGYLLFYTNGGGRPPGPQAPSAGAIWNRNHQLMYDMQGAQGGGYSSAQSSIVIPKPGAPGKYLLFTMEESEFDLGGAIAGQPQGRGLSYFEIDMSLNGGLGAVALADQRLHVPAYENLTAVRHANGQDYWIITVDASTGNFLFFLVNSSGIQAPISQPSGLSIVLEGPVKAAPDGAHLFIQEYLFAFDPATGQSSAPIQLPFSSSYSSTFSPNSRYLYTAKNGLSTARISQFDLQASDVAASRQEMALLPNTLCRGMQLAPDGKAYFLELPVPSQGVILLSAIECPNTDSPAISHAVFSFNITGLGFAMLPNFPDHLFANEGQIDVELGPERILECNGDTAILDAQNPGAVFLWSTGDTTQAIKVSAPGTYSVTVSNNCGAAADTAVVASGPNTAPELSIIGAPYICPGGSTLLSGQANESTTFLWQDGSSQASILVAEPGDYSLTVTDQCGLSTTATASVALLETPLITVNGPEALCPDEPATLLATSDTGDNYQWSTANTGPSADIVGPGTYSITVSNSCGAADTGFTILPLPLPQVSIMGDTILCPGDEKQLMAEALDATALRWSTGQQQTAITVTRPGAYQVIASNSCGEATAAIALQPLGCPSCFYIPNAFSPNDDGRNDAFSPIAACEVTDYRFQVFSRWGSLVFESGSPGAAWNGTAQGSPLPAGVYAWVLTYKLGRELQMQEGEVSLVR
ncbi:MAG: gliding motility-associated C-terminal domain-containing protein [Lewinellaceae bacterium]|nr:gliding motility-associated C-terminal domain-containing protein [Lewinellaceae bacterium]